MKKLLKLLVWSLAFTLCACVEPNEERIDIQTLQLEPESAKIEIGKTLQLKVVSSPTTKCDTFYFDWLSTNESVATINDYGVVTAVGEGTAKILCRWRDELTAVSTITVYDPFKTPEPEPEPEPTPEPEPEPTPEPEPEPTPGARRLDSMLSEQLIFSSRQLRYPGTVMQCFDFYDPSENGWIYFSQCAGDTTTGSKWLVVLSRVRRGAYGDNTHSGEEMLLRWFGHGTNLCVEQATDGGEDFLWLNSNGTVSGTGKNLNYGNNKTFCRLRFQPKTTFEHYTGENFYLGSYTDTTGKKWTVSNLQVSLDFDHRLMLVTASSSGKRHCIIYNLDAVLALKEQTITLNRMWGGEDGTNTERKQGTTTLSARVMDNLKPIGSFRIASNTSSKDYTKTWSTSFQGQAIYGDKIFWYEGQPLESVSGSGVNDDTRAYVEVFDYNGNRLKPRTRVVAVSDFENLKRLLDLNENLFSEAEGMQIKNGGKTLYLGFTSHLAGATSKNRLSTILEYDYE